MSTADSATHIHVRNHMNETVSDLHRIVMADLIDPVARLRRDYQVPLERRSSWARVHGTFQTYPAGPQVLRSAFDDAVEEIA
jgi:hypothetical protein